MAVNKKIKTVFQFRRDTTENWLLNKDTIPASGEPCYDIDLKTLRIGDGVTTYENLQVIGNVEGGDTSALQAEIANLKIAMENMQTDVDNVEENVSGLQDQVGETNVVEVHENITQITENVSNLTEQIEATNTEVKTIQDNLDSKADTTAVESMQTELKTYVDEQVKMVKIENIDDGEI